MSMEPITIIEPGTSTNLDNYQSILITLLEKNLDIPSYELTDNEKQWIQTILKESPTNFEEIDQFLEPILFSRQLNVHTIPKFIHLLAETYQSITHEKNIFDNNHIITFIKFTVDVIIDFICLHNFEVAILKSMVDGSLLLLKTNMEEKPIFRNSSSLPDLINSTLNHLSDIVLPPETIFSPDIFFAPDKEESVPAENGNASSTEAATQSNIGSLHPNINPMDSTNKCCWNFKFF